MLPLFPVMQGQLARSEGRDEMMRSKPLGFHVFSVLPVSASKLSPCVSFFGEVQMPRKVRKRYKCL